MIPVTSTLAASTMRRKDFSSESLKNTLIDARRQARKCRPKLIPPTAMKNTAIHSSKALSKWPKLAS